MGAPGRNLGFGGGKKVPWNVVRKSFERYREKKRRNKEESVAGKKKRIGGNRSNQ